MSRRAPLQASVKATPIACWPSVMTGRGVWGTSTFRAVEVRISTISTFFTLLYHIWPYRTSRTGFQNQTNFLFLYALISSTFEGSPSAVRMTIEDGVECMLASNRDSIPQRMIHRLLLLSLDGHGRPGGPLESRELLPGTVDRMGRTSLDFKRQRGEQAGRGPVAVAAIVGRHEGPDTTSGHEAARGRNRRETLLLADRSAGLGAGDRSGSANGLAHVPGARLQRRRVANPM